MFAVIKDENSEATFMALRAADESGEPWQVDLHVLCADKTHECVSEEYDRYDVWRWVTSDEDMTQTESKRWNRRSTVVVCELVSSSTL